MIIAFIFIDYFVNMLFKINCYLRLINSIIQGSPKIWRVCGLMRENMESPKLNLESTLCIMIMRSQHFRLVLFF